MGPMEPKETVIKVVSIKIINNELPYCLKKAIPITGLGGL
jgi:hypothetical protein